MFCPKCNQQQATEEMRFCSRCGFPLSVVADLLAHNGVLTKVNAETREDCLSPRQKGVQQGVLLLFASLVVGLFITLLSVFVIGSPELFIPITAGILFLSGILRVVYANTFERAGEIEEQAHGVAQVRAAELGYALPSPQRMLVTGYEAQRVNTAELVTPPSVTEQTTRLLDREPLSRPGSGSDR
ncbi:MAG: zinc ribbon domain-containing protein [Pyrinomonadaceae bacterium]|nr:zinc ribbon domain-containing protein [Pyrinomonadaceae bacterium]